MANFHPIYLMFVISLVIVLFDHHHQVYCLQNNSSSTPSSSPPSLISDLATNLSDHRPEENNSTEINQPILLSGDEFVDSDETPTLLFDNLGPQADQANSTSQASNETTTTTIANATATTTSSNNDSTSTSTVLAEGEPDSGDEIEEVEDEDTKEGKDQQQQQFRPPQNVSQYMDYIERLFHDLRHQITDLFEPHIPQLIRTSQMVQLSGSCSYDMLRMALALRQFEPWALRMIDSSGKVPEGIFEGSFTALGSYDECLNTVFAQSGASEPPPSTGKSDPGASADAQATGSSEVSSTRGKYCLVNVSPYLPPKPPADRVERMFQEEANRRNYTKGDQFSRLSPMFYYMKFRIGVCIPSTCHDSDMNSISEALSSSLKLNITVPHCRVRQNQPLTSHQLVGGFVFILLISAIVGATLLDCSRQNWLADKPMIMANDGRHSGDIVMLSVDGKPMQRLDKPILISNQCDTSNNDHLFTDQLNKNWSWMSFSLLANFKLYFDTNLHPRRQQQQKLARKQQTSDQRSSLGSKNQQASTNVIRCLDGIRVLSLCWVIIANSYITLDPRATKRLLKSREAPRDFLFQAVVQASLAIETFFFLSGVLMSLSFANRLKPASSSNKSDRKEANEESSTTIKWIHFYVHRYIRMTPATMLVIAFSMFAYRFGDGPLWFEATHKAHQSCSQNWWRHLLHIANFIDTRQMCFIHYWYIAADMQLFLFAPLLMFLLYKHRKLAYCLIGLIGSASMGYVFYTTYERNLPPTLLFYNSDPESRREFGNTIMTNPLTHVLPYIVGMLVGKLLTSNQLNIPSSTIDIHKHKSMAAFLGSLATMVALVEVFLPYKWNNSILPAKFLAALYAALFRFAWSLALAYLVISCRHERGQRCIQSSQKSSCCSHNCSSNRMKATKVVLSNYMVQGQMASTANGDTTFDETFCMCANGGNLVNRLLSLSIFTYLSKLSFVAYLIHLPLMSVFVSQTHGLFAFSHTLVIHLAMSYLVMTFLLSFILVHMIEFPFITFERYLFHSLFYDRKSNSNSEDHGDKFSVTCDSRLNGQQLDASCWNKIARANDTGNHTNVNLDSRGPDRQTNSGTQMMVEGSQKSFNERL